MSDTSTVQDAQVDDLDDVEDPFEDDEDDEIPAAEPVRAPRKAARQAPSRNPVARWMAARGWRSDYPRWVWATATGAAVLVGLGVIGAVAGGDEPAQTVARPTLTPTPGTVAAPAAPTVDPFVGMPPRHPLVEWVLTGKYDQQVVIANQARTSRDKSGALADPCRLWVGITLRQDGSKVVQMLLADTWSPAFPVPLFIGAQCGRPEPHQFGEVTVAAPNPATTVPTTSTTVAPEVNLGPDATVVENPVQQLRSAVAAGTSSTTAAPTTTTTPPAPVPFVHYATQGQGMLAVARMYGVTVDELAAVNGWPVDAALTLGQPLVIPGRFQ